MAVGTVEGDRDLYNASVLIHRGEIVLSYRKRLLPNYAVFDERRYFTPGDEPLSTVSFRGVEVAMTICEDIWSPTGPTHELAAGGAEVVLNLNASPYREGKAADREVMRRVGGVQGELAGCGGDDRRDHLGVEPHHHVVVHGGAGADEQRPRLVVEHLHADLTQDP